MKDFLVCVLDINDCVMKTLCSCCRWKQHPLLGPYFHLNINDLVLKISVIYFIGRVNDLVIQLFCVVSITLTGVHVSVVAPIVLFVQIIG